MKPALVVPVRIDVKGMERIEHVIALLEDRRQRDRVNRALGVVVIVLDIVILAVLLWSAS